jgi:hypothetical protein
LIILLVLLVGMVHLWIMVLELRFELWVMVFANCVRKMDPDPFV